MAICKRCGADDLVTSDICGNAGCVYCFGTPLEEITNDEEIKNTGGKAHESVTN